MYYDKSSGDRYYSIPETAKFLQTSPKQVEKAIQDGSFTSYRVGVARRLYLKESELIDFVNALPQSKSSVLYTNEPIQPLIKAETIFTKPTPTGIMEHTPSTKTFTNAQDEDFYPDALPLYIQRELDAFAGRKQQYTRDEIRAASIAAAHTLYPTWQNLKESHGVYHDTIANDAATPVSPTTHSEDWHGYPSSMGDD